MSRFLNRFHRSSRARRLAASRRRAVRPALESCEARTLLSDWYSIPVGFTPAQIQQAYNVNQISFNHGNGTIAGTGSGQTIAIVIEYDDPAFVNSTSPSFSTSDLAQFDHQVGLPDPPSFTKYNESGQTTSLPGPDPAGKGPNIDNAEGEEALDIEWAHAIAPGANIDVVEVNSFAQNDLYAGIETAQNLPGVTVVSMSFGTTQSGAGLDPYFSHNGVTFVASAGDQGQFLYPAASPNVLGVGGTNLMLINGGFSTWDYGSETVWNDQSGSTGGGPDQSVPGKPGPDVAFNAVGVAVYDSYNGVYMVPASSPYSSPFLVFTPWHSVNGTSIGAPSWAGLIAIADQGRALEGFSPLSSSLTLSLIHDMPSFDFHQYIPGSNSLGFSGTAVYGQGTPVANLVVDGLLQEPITIPTSNTIEPGQTLNGVVAQFKEYTAPAMQGTSLINWGDGTSSSGQVVSVGNGQYNVIGSHTYNTPGTYQVVAQVNGTWIQGSVQGAVTAAYSPDQRYINRLYEDFLHRSAFASPNELAAWTNRLQALEQQGNAPAKAQSMVASYIATSPEAWSDVVNQMYIAFLGRTVDPGGLSYWLSQLPQNSPSVPNNFSVEKVMAGILSSPEFQQDANNQHPSGNWNWSYILGLYGAVLGRGPSYAEANYWYKLLPSLGAKQVAYDIVTSTEFRTDAVQTFYGMQAQASRPYFPDLLNRGASLAEINFWVNSGLDFLSIEIAMASSPESYTNA